MPGTDQASEVQAQSGTPLSVSVDLKANGLNGPITVIQGGMVQLTWTAINANNCTFSGGGGGSSGSVTVSITQRTVFGITCDGVGGSAADSVTVNVQEKPAPAFLVAPATGSVGRGGTTSFSALYDPDGSGPEIQQDVTQAAAWQSENATIASIVSPGQVRGEGVGSAFIRATYSGLSGQASLQVNLTGSRPTVRTLAPKNVSKSQLSVLGRVNPNGLSTTAWVEYGLGSLAAATPPRAVGAGGTAIDVQFDIALPVEGDYSFRVVAKNQLGTTRGATLSTRSSGNPALALVPSTVAAKTGDTASFRATYDPDGNGREPSIDVTTEVHWLVSNPAVAVRTDTGKFRAVGPGSTKITAVYNPSGPIVYDYDITNFTVDAELKVEGSTGTEEVHLAGPAEAEYAASSSAGSAGSGNALLILGGLVAALLLVGAGGIYIVMRMRRS
jgi:hypothetical protein